MRLEGGKEEIYDSFMPENSEEQKFYSDLYLNAISVLDKTNARKFYDNLFTKQFILYGFRIGASEPSVTAVWQNGFWTIISGEDVMTISSDEEAIDFFISKVWGRFYDYKVYYKESIPERPDEFYIESSDFQKGEEGEEIGVLVGNYGSLTSYNELDNEQEVANLKSEFE